jgi:hypothetical protein
MQHAQVRTAEFKEWFGDWEAAQVIHELKNGKPFIVSGNEFADFSEPLNMKKLRLEAFVYGEKNIVGQYENKCSGIKLEVRRGGIDEAIQHNSGPDKLKALAAIKDVLVNGYVVYDGVNPKNTRSRLVAISKRVDIGEKQFVVTAGLREDASGRLFYDHELLDTRRAEGISSQSSEGLSPQHPAPTSTRLNDYYRRFVEKDTNSSKVVDENGEPMVVYHGTPDGRFTEFREDKQASNTKFDDSAGFFFTPDKKYAESYADWEDEDSYIERLLSGNDAPNNANKDIKPVYLRIINPIDANTGHKGSKEIFNAAKENGNDGVFSNQTANKMNEIVAFNPNQIKSATGNGGGFSKESNDIRKALFFGNTAEILVLMKRL